MAWFEPLVELVELLAEDVKFLATAATDEQSGLGAFNEIRKAQAIGRVGLATTTVQATGSLVIEAVEHGLPGHGGRTTHDPPPATDTTPKQDTKPRGGGSTTEPTKKAEGSLCDGFDYAGFAIPIHGLIHPGTFLGVGRHPRISNGAFVVTDSTAEKVLRVVKRTLANLDSAVKPLKRRRNDVRPDLETLREIRIRLYDQADNVRRQLPFMEV